MSSGTLTEDQETSVEDALQLAITSSRSSTSSNSSNNPLSSLISSGTITQDQADAVKSALDASFANAPSYAPNMKFSNSSNDSAPKPVEDALNSLVSSGTIMQDQETDIGKALKEAYNSQMSNLNSLQYNQYTLSNQVSSDNSGVLENS